MSEETPQRSEGQHVSDGMPPLRGPSSAASNEHTHEFELDGGPCALCGKTLVQLFHEQNPEASSEPSPQPWLNLPCGCTIEPQDKQLSSVFWNPFNRVVQCHQCGQIYEPVKPVT